MKTAIFFVIAILLSAPIVHADSDLAYYQQFIYQSKADADGNVTTRFLDTVSPQGTFGFSIGTSPEGQALVASAELFLMPDSTFVLKYQEMTAQGMMTSFPMFQHFTGTWSVPGNQLLVGDIATGSRAVDSTGNVVQLTFIKDLVTPGLNGKTAIADYTFSNETPDNP